MEMGTIVQVSLYTIVYVLLETIFVQCSTKKCKNIDIFYNCFGNIVIVIHT